MFKNNKTQKVKPMHDKSKDDFKVELYTPQYREKTLALLGLLWKKTEPERYEALFIWKYEDNPYTRSPLIIICIAGDEVVGVLGHMVQKIMINGTPQNICIPVDGIVHPDYRMYGVYSRMLREGVRQILALTDIYDFKFFFNASSNHGSAPGLVKLGWKVLAPRRYLNKFSLKNIIVSGKMNHFPEGAKIDLIHKKCHYELEITSVLRPDLIDSVSRHMADKIFVVHDPVFLNWRYELIQEQVKYVYLYSDLKPVAYMLLNCRSSKQSSIEEYGFIDPESLYVLMTKTMELMRIGILRLFVASIPEIEMRILSKAGFIMESKLLLRLLKKKIRTPVYIKNIKGEGTDQDYFVNGINCLDGRNWRFFHADIL